MTYSINGTTFVLQPTIGKWLPRERLGIDGNGHPIYAPYREFEIEWELVDPSDFNQLQTFFSSVNNTGSAVVELPQYGAATYIFYSYTGCVVREPEFAEYFNQHQSRATLLITRIRT